MCCWVWQTGRINFSTGCFPTMKAKPSTVPFLYVGQVVFLGVVLREANKISPLSQSHKVVVCAMVACLTLWGVLSAYLALQSAFSRPGFLRSYPGTWLPLVPLVIVLIFFFASDSFRAAMEVLVDSIDRKWFVFVHGWRALAAGTVIKAFCGTFPRLFGLIVGTLDMLYGISAWILFIAMSTGSSVSSSAMLSWHVVGIAVIVPIAPIIMQLSLPGIAFTQESKPPMASVFQFPMVLAPSLVVPCFIGFNLLMIWQVGKDL